MKTPELLFLRQAWGYAGATVMLSASLCSAWRRKVEQEVENSAFLSWWITFTGKWAAGYWFTCANFAFNLCPVNAGLSLPISTNIRGKTVMYTWRVRCQGIGGLRQGVEKRSRGVLAHYVIAPPPTPLSAKEKDIPWGGKILIAVRSVTNEKGPILFIVKAFLQSCQSTTVLRHLTMPNDFQLFIYLPADAIQFFLGVFSLCILQTGLFFLFRDKESIVIVKKSMLRSWWIFTYWGPWSPKKCFLKNVVCTLLRLLETKVQAGLI